MTRPTGYLLPEGITVVHMLAEVARGFDVAVDDILGPGRGRTIVTARACAMAVVRGSTDLSLPAIGDIFDRDHTTVMHHVAKVLADPELAEAVRLVVEELSPPPQPPRLFALPDDPIQEAV